MNTIDKFYSQWKGEIEKLINEESVELIDAKLVFYAGGYSLRCLVDYPNGGITVEICAMLNKKIVEFLESSNALGADFIVEVDSPGLDRPLRTCKDFARMIGKVVGVWPKAPLDGKMYFEGKIADASGQSLTLEAKGKKYIIDFEKINLGKEKLEG